MTDAETTGNEPPGEVRAGLAFRIIGFFGAIIVGAMFFAILSPGVEMVLDHTSSMVDSGGAASESVSNTRMVWSNILFYVAFVSLLGLLAGAVYERQGGRL
ncbi:hypothetical protein M0R89_10500 [Halorussus limi]|uniref:Uncharacterized protein n=1 Tax=Halorussus limi TaxID=2938695 RepID=A0A8U0HQ17_9EURY|nr:hypothetical protein [Halorussus limi]UPV72978.1 hypothetical protein M0R89_10500 [Halorussus limi]